MNRFERHNNNSLNSRHVLVLQPKHVLKLAIHHMKKRLLRRVKFIKHEACVIRMKSYISTICFSIAPASNWPI